MGQVKFIRCQEEQVPESARPVKIYMDGDSLYFVLLDEEQNPFLKDIDFEIKI